MILWWLLGEMLQRQSAWLLPNLLATTFYGERAYRSGFRAATWSGLAGPFVVYCAAGVVFALVMKGRWSGWRLVLASLAASLLLNWLLFGIILSHMNPLVGIYSPDRLILVSHAIYAFGLVTYPGFARRLLPPAEPPPVPPPFMPHSDGEMTDGIPPETWRPVGSETIETAETDRPDLHEEIGGGVAQDSGEAPSGPVPSNEAGVIPRPATDQNAGG
ncbi:MAG TPA: hypothetical protein VGL72_06240 [Bryobacteraceae bacterium]|jgi:hypothetical protein